MLSLEQIKRLEEKVFKAVELIKALKEENNLLKSELGSANSRIDELEVIISDFRNNQSEIEEGIIKAIRQLEDLDNISVSEENSDKIPEENNIDIADSEADETEKNSLFENYNSSSPADTNPAGDISENGEEDSDEESESANPESSAQLDIF
ncbi:MAG: cell division protein ZapB [Spirochaetia bacterium]|jgi:FtsZ-binding cell division protein ZapB|nr:cell division protein ZapB [Spirochaetia bacterium]